ncbi:uncharacterized protein LOC141912504 [Tubulanus polymorphus]|uniref:uncharacterized protein LOC141912504 n=1 Tax=Tubulanus polymorphus TaxID=672921 RepID=UPI003DA5712E
MVDAMDISRLGICVFVALSFSCQGVRAISCYECSSDTDSACSNRYWLAGKLKQCSFVYGSCQIYMTKGSDGETVVSRGCSVGNLGVCNAHMIAKKTTDIYSMIAGCCDTDACNDARDIRTNGLLLAAVITAVWCFFCFSTR